MDAWLQTIFETVTQHVPDSAAWLPYAGTGLLGLFGLVLMVKGAKLAPLMAACAFLGIGGVGGSFVANWVGTPVWPTIIVAGLVGFALGLALFKVWLAILVGGCFVAASLTLYGVRVVSPHVANYTSRNLDAAEGLVTLPAPDAAVAAAESAPGELTQLWSYLGATVPGFRAGFWAIVVSTGLAGLVFGLLLPRAARALFAATAGTFCLLVALTAVLRTVWPAVLAWLASLGGWSWLIVGGIWGVSLLINMLGIREKRPKKLAGDGVPHERPATA